MFGCDAVHRMGCQRQLSFVAVIPVRCSEGRYSNSLVPNPKPKPKP